MEVISSYPSPPKNFDLITSFSVYLDKMAIYSYFLANYSISLQKSSLSNILPVHDKVIIIFHDPPRPPAQNLGGRDSHSSNCILLHYLNITVKKIILQRILNNK